MFSFISFKEKMKQMDENEEEKAHNKLPEMQPSNNLPMLLYTLTKIYFPCICFNF